MELFQMNNVVSAIKANAKRMNKLAILPTSIKAREQAHKYVIAECAAQHIKATEDEIIHMSIMIFH